ncbi:MAG: sigma-70 family RNA polymerase sigma factor [Chromatiales bacterium]|nr:sigma-70 family RNA polymerase sigma factor [Chromatiales bacterium]
MKVLEHICATRTFKKKLEASRTRLYRMALAWCGDPMLADDLVQDTLIKAMQKSHQLRDGNKLEHWLSAILSNTWREHLRRQKPGVEIDDEMFVCENCPEVEMTSQEIVNRVRRAVGKLPIGQREVLTLVDLEGFAYAETAEILDIPVGTVMSRLCRARRALTGFLTDLYMPAAAATEAGRPHLRRVK